MVPLVVTDFLFYIGYYHFNSHGYGNQEVLKLVCGWIAEFSAFWSSFVFLGYEELNLSTDQKEAAKQV